MAAGNRTNNDWEAENVMQHHSGVIAIARNDLNQVWVKDEKNPVAPDGWQKFAPGGAIAAYPAEIRTF